ncbi:molybdenum cofactor guanylyltransferase MobA [Chitinilyticum piscinae]|uniref:Molybdenum cofactor guanylyltransferase n=1 Tax=Chitinilyticum piscinae TaxID=2866724 RepID=A0A8J7KAJ5_9NEIS|nr:molybdenum cofactor guanylyltransferase MobA [Chitinilyticum piscinae]MBE9609199.1 molybdenum cofactor guanylyltransferase [Chitinilyticum piscinae]
MSMVDAVILSGGAGRRMNGRDKGLIELSGRPLVGWVIDALQAQTCRVGHIMISANRNLPDYSRFGYPVLRDVYPGFPGPLAGVHSAALASPADALLVLPCDAPFLPDDLLARLLGKLHEGGGAVTVRVGGRQLPYPCLLERAILPQLIERMARGDFGLAEWLAELGAAEVELPAGSIANINSFDDLAIQAARLAGVETIALPTESASGGARAGVARAAGELRMQADTLQLFEDGSLADLLGLARAAAMLAAKRAGELVPQHAPQPLGGIRLEFRADRLRNTLHCQASVEAREGRAETEALLAVNLALITIMESCRETDRGLVLGEVRLLDVAAAPAAAMPAVL